VSWIHQQSRSILIYIIVHCANWWREFCTSIHLLPSLALWKQAVRRQLPKQWWLQQKSQHSILVQVSWRPSQRPESVHARQVRVCPGLERRMNCQGGTSLVRCIGACLVQSSKQVWFLLLQTRVSSLSRLFHARNYLNSHSPEWVCSRTWLNQNKYPEHLWQGSNGAGLHLTPHGDLCTHPCKAHRAQSLRLRDEASWPFRTFRFGLLECPWISLVLERLLKASGSCSSMLGHSRMGLYTEELSRHTANMCTDEQIGGCNVGQRTPLTRCLPVDRLHFQHHWLHAQRPQQRQSQLGGFWTHPVWKMSTKNASFSGEVAHLWFQYC